MAALTESGLRNLSYGDRDSVGFFQMRVGIWDQGAYAGYPSNPQLQIQWFIDHAVAVKAQYPELAANPNSWGDLVADVEQPAAQYRFRYQLQLQTAQALLRGADLTSGAAAVPAAAAAAAAPAPPPVPVREAALKVAMHYAGGERGAASLDTGPTSAELVRYAYAQQGVQLPKVASLQYDVGIPVSSQHLKPGDAVFFSERDGYVDHVGLYVGNGRFVSAAERGGGISVSSISDPPFTARYVGARRYTAEALGNPSSYARPLPTIKR
jgi:cell wall-associated NlpC family hydrolase